MKTKSWFEDPETKKTGDSPLPETKKTGDSPLPETKKTGDSPLPEIKDKGILELKNTQLLRAKHVSKKLVLPPELIAKANLSDFDFQRPTLIMNLNLHASPILKQHDKRSPSPTKFMGDSRSVSFPSVREDGLKKKKTRPKNRTLSPPPPATPRSDEFKDARLGSKRFSTPVPRRKGNDGGGGGGIIKKLITRESINHRERRKENSSRIFDSTGVKVSAFDAMMDCRIEKSDLYIGHRFAIGAGSRLYHGNYKTQHVAVKFISLPDDKENDTALASQLEKQFTGEASILSRLHHQNIIKLVGVIQDPFGIVTEYLPGGTLRGYMHKLEKRALPLQKLIAMGLAIARGMDFVHSKSIIHRDLKPENILFDEDCCVKIADFGIACDETYCNSSLAADDKGTYRFMAPEMIKNKPYGRKVDVYSFGLVFWEMLTGRIPFEDMNPYQAAHAVVNKNLRPAIPANCPAPLGVFIEQCWTLHPEKRPKFEQIVKVLEQFESAVARDGLLNQVPSIAIEEHNKKSSNWMQKFKHSSTQSNTATAIHFVPKLL